MTPAERALLLAVAKRLTTQLDYYGGDTYRALVDAIAAAEAEAEPEAPAEDRSCPTCRFEKGAECLAEGGYTLDDNGICQDWQPKPTETAVCPLCNGKEELPWAKSPCGDEMYKCPDCNGTGKKEKK